MFAGKIQLTHHNSPWLAGEIPGNHHFWLVKSPISRGVPPPSRNFPPRRHRCRWGASGRLKQQRVGNGELMMVMIYNNNGL